MTKQELGQKIKLKYPQYKNIDDVELADKIIAKYPVYQSQITEEKPKAGFGQYNLKEAVEDVGQTFGNIKKTAQDTAKKIIAPVRAMEAGDQGVLRTFGQSFGAAAGGISKGIGDVFTGAVKAALPQQAETTIKDTMANVIEKMVEVDKALGNPIGSLYEKYQTLSPKTKRDIEAVLGIGSLATDILGAGVTKKVGQETVKQTTRLGARTVKTSKELGKQTVKFGSSVVSKVAEKTPELIKGGVSVASELTERIPRAVTRLKEGAEDAAARARRIRESTPEVANAIKSNLDDKFINTILEADDVTRKAYKQVVDIAEETPKGIGMKKQPSIVSGELAAKQFDLINKEKKKIGEQIGEKIKQLSKTDKVDISDAVISVDDILSTNGIGLKYTKKGTKLDFSGTSFTPAERTKIQQLYDLATEGGLELSPLQIKAKDQLFSKLQREATLEGIGKIMIETPEGTKSLFSVFRDIYSKKLDDIIPEIKDLNKKYRDLTLITEDIEDSILRTPNFNITKTADPSEFAKVNLRRIFGESQSSPVFEAIADRMDSLARSLGYADASPKQVAEFAQELRKLYPESIPKTGFQGGISTGLFGAVSGLANVALKAGAPNIKDQRKALIRLLDSYLVK